MTPKEARDYFIARESTALQWKYLTHILTTLVGFFLIAFFSGPGHTESVVGIKRCDPGWWSLFGTFLFFGVLMTIIAILV